MKSHSPIFDTFIVWVYGIILANIAIMWPAFAGFRSPIKNLHTNDTKTLCGKFLKHMVQAGLFYKHLFN